MRESLFIYEEKVCKDIRIALHLITRLMQEDGRIITMSNSDNFIIGSQQKYVFSGSLTESMVSGLLAAPQFEPMDVLVSQLDRSGVDKMLEYMDRGLVKSLFIDSGAYSVHSQGFEKVSKGRFGTFNEMVDEYIEYVNKLDDKIIAVAQFDHIPGVFKQPKKPSDYIESAELSWENFLYMYPKMKSPEKLIAVFHMSESFEHLGRMLNWKDGDGNRFSYVGISPANDAPVGEKDVYLKEVYDYIAASSNPNVKTHLFGYTSLPGLPKFPWYTVDSTSHRQRPAYNKIFTNKWGTISLSKTRSAKAKGDKSFTDIADPQTLKELSDLAESYNLTLDLLCEESWARTVFDILQVQEYVRTHPYKKPNMIRQKQLFKIN